MLDGFYCKFQDCEAGMLVPVYSEAPTHKNNCRLNRSQLDCLVSRSVSFEILYVLNITFLLL